MASKFLLTSKLRIDPPSGAEIKKLLDSIQSKMKTIVVPISIKASTSQLRQIQELRKQLNELNTQAGKALFKGAQASGRSLGNQINAMNKSAQKASKSFSGVSTSVQGATSDIESFGKASALALRRFGGFVVATFAIRNLLASFTEGIREAIGFQKQMVQISQITGQSVKDVGALNSEIDRLATTFGVSSTKLATAAQTLAQAGLSADDTKVALEALAKSDISPTFKNLGNTLEGAIAAMAQFKFGTKDLESRLGSLSAVAGAFAVEADDLVTAVSRSGAAFEAAGGNLNEFIALFTSVRSTTRESAESIATGFRTIFTRLQRVRTINFFENMGIQLRNLKGEFIGPFEAIKKLNQALTGLATTDPRFAQIIEELGGFRQVSKVIPLIQEFETAQKALIVAQQGGNTLTKDAVKAQQALAVQLEKTREEFLKLIRDVIQSDSFASLAKQILTITQSLIKLADSIVPVLPILSLIASGAFGQGIKNFLQTPRSGKGFLGNLFPRGFASGGTVGGSGSGDKVPALLEPGEFVIRKKIVDKIGVGALDELNKDHVGSDKSKRVKIQRFKSGGLVKSVTNNPLAASGALGALGAIVISFADLGEEASKLTLSVAAAVTQFALFSTLLKNSTKNTELQRNVSIKENRVDQLTAFRVNLNKAGDDIINGFDSLNKEVQALKANLRKIVADPKAPQSVKDAAVQKLTDARAKRQEFFLDNQGKLPRLQRIDDLTEKRLKSEKDQIRSLNEQAAKLDKLNNIFSVISSAGLVLGQVLDDAGKKAIRGGNLSSGTNQIIGGGAASGAGQGAAIGLVAVQLFSKLNPIATLITTTFGGAILGAVQAIEKAKQEVERVKFAIVLDDFKKNLDGVSKGTTTAARTLPAIVSGLDAFDKRLSSADTDSFESLQGEIKGVVISMNDFFGSLSKTVGSIDEFRNVLGDDTLKRFGRIANIPFDQLTKSVKDQINLNQKKNQIDNQSIRLQQDLFSRNSSLLAFTSSIADAELQFNLLTDGLSNLTNKELPDFSDVISRVGSGNSGLFQREIKKTGNVLGPASSGLQQEASTVDKALRVLPNILLKARNSNLLSDDGDIVAQIMKEVRNQVKGSGANLIIDSIAHTIQHDLIGSEGKPQELVNKLRGNLFSVLESISNPIKDIVSIFENTSKLLNSGLNKFVSNFNVMIDTFAELTTLELSKVDVKESITTFFQDLRAVPPAQRLGTAAQADNERLFSLGANNNPEQIANAILSLNRQIGGHTSNIDSGNLNPQQIKQEVEARASLIAQANNLTQALELLTKQSSVLTTAQGALQHEQEKAAKTFNFVSDFVFGDFESKRSTAKTLAAASVAGATGNLNSVPQNLLQPLQDLLRNFSDVKLSIFGKNKDGSTRSGLDLERHLVKQDLLAANVKPEEAEKISQAFTPEMEKLAGIIQAETTKSINATIGLQTIAAAKLDILKTTNETGFSNIVKAIQESANKQLIDRLTAQQQSIESELGDIDKKFGAINQLRQAGLSDNPEQFNKQVGAIKGASNREQLAQQSVLLGQVSRINGRNSLTRFLARGTHGVRTNLNDATDILGIKKGGQTQISSNQIDIKLEQFLDKFTNAGLDVSAIRPVIKKNLADALSGSGVAHSSGRGIDTTLAAPTVDDIIKQGFAPLEAQLKNVSTQLNNIDNNLAGNGISPTAKLSDLSKVVDQVGDANIQGMRQRQQELIEQNRLLQEQLKANKPNVGIPISPTTSTVPTPPTPQVPQAPQKVQGPVSQSTVTPTPAFPNTVEPFRPTPRILAAREEEKRKLTSDFHRKFEELKRNGASPKELSDLTSGLRIKFKEIDARQFATGGLVTGSGAGDSVSAKLTPGEFVLNKRTVNRIGIGGLNTLNKGGGAGSISNLDVAINKFSGAAVVLANSMNNFPREVSHIVNGRIEVIINGAEVLSSLGGSFERLIIGKVNQGINNFAKKNFPKLPQQNSL